MSAIETGLSWRGSRSALASGIGGLIVGMYDAARKERANSADQKLNVVLGFQLFPFPVQLLGEVVVY